MKSYVPPKTNALEMSVFADRLEANLFRAVFPAALMAVQESLARAAGYADFHAATCHAEASSSSRMPLLPGVATRRLKEWAKPFQHALNEAQGSPKDALAYSWGHASYEDLLRTLDTGKQVPLDHGYLRQVKGQGPWIGRSSSTHPTAPSPFLILGHGSHGDRWGMDERQACCHLHLVGPAGTTRHRWVQQALKQRHAQSSPTVWMGEDVETFEVAKQAPRLGSCVDWTSTGAADVNVRTLNLQTLTSLQMEVMRHLYEQDGGSLLGNIMDQRFLFEAARSFSLLILAQPPNQKIGLREMAQFWISDEGHAPRSGTPHFSDEEVKSIWKTHELEEILSSYPKHYSSWWAKFQNWFDPDLPMVELSKANQSQAWRLPEVKMQWGNLAKESLTPALICNVAIQLMHASLIQQMQPKKQMSRDERITTSETIFCVIESDHVWSPIQCVLPAQLRSFPGSLMWVQDEKKIVLHPVFHEEKTNAIAVTANLATRIMMNPAKTTNAQNLRQGECQLFGMANRVTFSLDITQL